ncbi:hypothetical protein MRB53_023841 [Persea americana]|uniref:Uncharacterized protein n=1 Tax=Persea americana TaxID=3435 RepID=A0ACC2LB33_PERAE|nr:hypothetical protein MRB53_023841 [Persea americana]
MCNMSYEHMTIGSSRLKYYHEPRSGRRFRSRKEVERFIQTGEVPRYKSKPKIEKSNVENINSEPTPSGNIAWPPTLEPYSKHLPSFMGGGKSNQQSEVGGTIIEQDGTESTIGIQQPVPSNVDGLETMFNVERENAIGRAHQSEINTQEKGVPKSKSRKKSDLKKETRGRRVIEQSELENVVVGTQQSNQSASFNFPRHEASSSRTKRGAPKIDRDIFERIGREICKKAIFANSKTGAAGCMIPQDVHTMIPREEIASLEPVQTVKRIVQVASLPPATPQAGHIL